MKLTVEAKALAKTLGALNRIVERRTTIPILSHIRIAARDGKLVMTATDLDIEATADVVAEIEVEGETTVPAHILNDLVRKLPDGAQIAIEVDGASAVLKAGRFRSKLNTLPVDDFPNIAIGDLPHAFRLPADALARIIARSGFAISTEETRYYLNGIYLHLTEDGAKLTAVATDGHRLAKIAVPAPDGTAGLPGVIVPRKTVAEVDRAARDAGSSEVLIEISPQKIRFTFPSLTLVSKLIDGTFPDYQRVIPKANERKANLERAALSDAIDRVMTMATTDRGRRCTFTFNGEGLALSAANADQGNAEDTIDATWAGEDFIVGFNGTYVQDALNAIGGESVGLAFDNPGAPALLTSPEHDDMLVVLMPMRV